jgi:CHAT domain-containing protein/tetratricopeptide (TPR) repeat protein
LLSVFFSTAGQDLSVADSLLLDAQFEQVIRWADKQLDKDPKHDVSILLKSKKVEALIGIGKFEDAQVLLNSIEPEATSLYLKSVVQMNYGSLFLHQGLYDASHEVLESSLQNLAKEKGQHSLEEAQALSYLGNLYRATGKYAQAEEQLGRALALRQQRLPASHEWIAASLNDLGLVYGDIDNDKAISYFEKALAIYQRLHGRDHPKIAIAETNLGLSYSRLELYGDATNNFESALKIWERIYPNAHPTKAFLLYNLGETYWKLHDAKAAVEYYRKALMIYQQSYGNKHPDIATVHNALGRISLHQRDFQAALSHYQNAMIANVRNFNDEDSKANPRINEIYNGRILLNSLLYKAQALEARYYHESIKLSDLTLGVRTLQVCDTLIDQLRQRIANESDKIALGTVGNEVYSSGARLSHEIAEVTIKKKRWNELSFYFAERSKSAVLLEAISDVNAKSFAGIPGDLIEEERKIKASITVAMQKLSDRPDGPQEVKLREEVFQLNRKYEAFIKNLEAQYPQYYNLKYNRASPSILHLQEKIDRSTALISYFIDEANRQLYVFIITSGDYKVITRTLPDDFDKYITALRNGLYLNSVETHRRAALFLSKVLMPTALPRSVSSLVFIPTGRLSIIPFETLFYGNFPKTALAKDLPYLIKKYSIRYEFAASLIFQKKVVAGHRDISILLCAPINFKPQFQLSALPATESEVTEIAALFNGRNFKTSTFKGAEADERITKSGMLKNYRYLHFATHGIADEHSPELSRIFLNSSTSGEDGILFAPEIYNMEMNAELVTLSACETGLGKISKGEGVIGLSRALVYAGARNVMVSFWSVADQSTSELMKAFYRILLFEENGDFGESLRKAKIELMRDERYRSPYYWAPFVMIGF